MKNVDPYFQSSKKPRMWLSILLVILLDIAIVGTLYLVFKVLFELSFQEKTYEVHHPALYFIQEDFFQLGENVYYIKDGKCLSFDENKETIQIDLEHISEDYCVSNDILYVYQDEHIYAYNSSLEEISIYYTGVISGMVGKRFIVLDDYIYTEGYNHHIKKNEFYKYSMMTGTKEVLDWDGQYPSVFISEGFYYNGIFYKYDDNIRCYSYGHPGVFYNSDRKKIEIKEENGNLIINNKYFDFEPSFRIGEQVYLNSEYLIFTSYNPMNDENCTTDIMPCISQLRDVKLWKYNIKTGQLSIIKQFNDYTILVSFDENNYHYYYGGKLYSNDIEVEETPKIEVGDIFTYYTSNHTPNLYLKEIRKSTTSIAYISGKFYVVHEENNSDIKEFHGN